MVLKDKVALITGASHGIGKAAAIAFASAGADVAFTYRGSDEGARETTRLIEAQGRRAHAMHADMTIDDDCSRIANEALAIYGRVDVLVNNAGGGQYSSSDLLSLTLEQWDLGLGFNLRAPFIVSQIIARSMVERLQGGAIVNISSVHSSHVWPRDSAYGVAKAGLNRLTKSMALEWAHLGIRVNAVAPGYINTSETAQEQAHYDAGDNLAAPLIAAGRTGTPAEIAALCLFLASDAASYVTGQTIFADGALLLPPITTADYMRSDRTGDRVG